MQPVSTCFLACPHLFLNCHWSPSALPLVLSLRVTARRNVESPAYCDDVVVDVFVVELEEPVDNPGRTIGK